MNGKMCNPMHFEPPPDFEDPRLQPDFQPEHWPLCNGEAAPQPDAVHLHERRCIEFLAAYYLLNVLNARLLAARTDGAPEPVRKGLLQEIDAATVALEKLEDRYAPIGFFGEPIMDSIAYRSIDFVRPEFPRLYPRASTLSSHVAIPGLQEIPESELRGPIKVIRLGHGKVDL
jgi:hypothetical protein